MRIACQTVVAEKLFLDEVDEESSNSAWCIVLRSWKYKRSLEKLENMVGLYCALLVESNKA